MNNYNYPALNGSDLTEDPVRYLEYLRDNDKVIRDMIQHENDLINARIAWSTVSQGFLFTAMRLATTSADDVIKKFQENSFDVFLDQPLECLIIWMPIVGIVISSITIWGVLRALKARARLIDWHELHVINNANTLTIISPKSIMGALPFPLLMGSLPGGTLDGRPNKLHKIHALWSPNLLLPIFLGFIWFILVPIISNWYVKLLLWPVLLIIFIYSYIKSEQSIT
ncbi:hypothetical protein [Methylomonas koyamae]|uniref:hypothetical protein n=1 Tax=Methylomonas koyamae TaxID=702114 RepID=UPI0012F6B6C3|nr:hypothetical protein [Methylomonas koyamae]